MTSFQTGASIWEATISLTLQLTASRVSNVISSEPIQGEPETSEKRNAQPSALHRILHKIPRLNFLPFDSITVTRTHTPRLLQRRALLTAFHLVYSPLQTLHGSRRVEREEEAEAHQDHVHQRAAQGAGAGFCRDALPGYLHQRGAGAENRSDWSQSAGTQPPAPRRLQLRTITHN